jgi:RHS repeat-associated protein
MQYFLTFGTSSISLPEDANGNVTDLLNADGNAVGHYEYSPYGQVISSTGTATEINKFRFSTKYWDDEVQLGYWGYRYYHPDGGRWLSRDPIGERGGDLYGFVGNDPIGRTDIIGLFYEGEWRIEDGRLIINEPRRTDAVKNRPLTRIEVQILVNNMLVKRSKACPIGETGVIVKQFDPGHRSTVINMYFTPFFALGQVLVNLDGTGLYQVDCCTKVFKKWVISITGSFRDDFDQLIPVPGPKKGIGSLPVTFVGEWVEVHKGEGW